MDEQQAPQQHDADEATPTRRRGRPRLEDGIDAMPARGRASADTGDPDREDAILRAHIEKLVPEHLRAPGWELLGQACLTFGIDPAKPTELVKWDFVPGGTVSGQAVPDRVKLVTAGGWKGYYPLTDETEHALAIVFNLYQVDKATGARFMRSLPVDLTLPRHIVTGVSPKRDHVFEEGYLKRPRTPAEIARDLARRGASSR